MIDLYCGEDGVTDAADYAAEQSARWAKIARSLRRRPLGRGYRLAVSRSGVWALRAARAVARFQRSGCTPDERAYLVQLDTLASRYDSAELERAAFGMVA